VEICIYCLCEMEKIGYVAGYLTSLEQSCTSLKDAVLTTAARSLLELKLCVRPIVFEHDVNDFSLLHMEDSSVVFTTKSSRQCFASSRTSLLQVFITLFLA
jgi:hypothetical protein